MDKELSDEEAWAGYRKYIAAFDTAGIPWNKKGSPHRLLLKAKWYLRQISFSKIVAFTFRANMSKLAENITANNALLQRLKRNG